MAQLLSLVVIFTQSIQLSKIVERYLLLSLHALGRLEHLCSRFNSHAVGTSLEIQHQAVFSRLSKLPIENGGAERVRTADPLLAKQVLSQLSYSPLPSAEQH